MRMFALLTVALALALAGPSVGTCGPLLNEIMAAPASDWNGDGSYHFRDDEWIEIVNPGPGSLDLEGYYLGDEDGGFVYGFTGSLPEGGVRVVFGCESVAWEIENGLPATGLRLKNGGDTVTLWHVVGDDTILVDAYTYKNHEAEADRSTGRMPDGGPEWQLFDALNNYNGSLLPAGNGLPPTPGQPNTGDPPVPVQECTWGRVKSVYR